MVPNQAVLYLIICNKDELLKSWWFFFEVESIEFYYNIAVAWCKLDVKEPADI